MFIHPYNITTIAGACRRLLPCGLPSLIRLILVQASTPVKPIRNHAEDDTVEFEQSVADLSIPYTVPDPAALHRPPPAEGALAKQDRRLDACRLPPATWRPWATSTLHTRPPTPLHQAHTPLTLRTHERWAHLPGSHPFVSLFFKLSPLRQASHAIRAHLPQNGADLNLFRVLRTDKI